MIRFRARSRDGNGHGGGCGLSVSSWVFAKSGIFNSRGSTPTFTRATGSTVRDFESLIKPVLSGEVRGQGMRRVFNRVDKSEDISGLSTYSTPVSVTEDTDDYPDGAQSSTVIVADGQFEGKSCATNLLVVGKTYTARVAAKAVSASQKVMFTDGLGTGGSLDITDEWQEYAITFVAANVAMACINATVGGGTIKISKWQVEDVTGQTNQNPSEYVSVGVLSAPFHGWGVDGVKYYPTQNANTVASNVITEAEGSAIDPASTGVPWGYRTSPARVNICLQSEDFDTTWASSGGGTTVTTNTHVAPDGTTSADTIEADANNGGRYQGVTAVNSYYVWSIYLRSGDATRVDLGIYDSVAPGFVNVTASVLEGSATLSGTTTVAVTDLTSAWCRIQLKTDAALNANAHVLYLYPGGAPATGGEDIVAWGSQFESTAVTSNFASVYIKTTTAAVTCNADVLLFPRAGNVNDSEGSVYFCGAKSVVANGQGIIISPSSYVGPSPFYHHSDNGNGAIYDGTTGAVAGWATTGQIKGASFWKTGGNCNICIDGTLGTAFSYDGSFGFSGDANIQIARADAFFIGTVAEFRIQNRAYSAARMQALTQ